MYRFIKKATMVLVLTLFGFAIIGNAIMAEEEPITLRFALVSSPAHQHNQAVEAWAKKVEEDTKGRLRIRVLGSAQLGGERDNIEGWQMGSIELAQVSTGPLSAFVSDFSVMSLPYVFTDYDQIKRVVNGPVGKNLFAQLEPKNIKGLTWFTNGFRSVFTRNKAVNNPQDLRGLKIRVMESPLMVSTLNAMGASATPMAYGELYTALQQGVMDGAENAPGNMLNDKFFEVCKYYSLTEHFAPPGVVGISMNAFERLPKDLQEYLVESAKWLGEYEMEMDKANQEKAIDELKAKGVQVNTVDKASFQKAVRPVIEEFSSKISPELMELLKKEIGL